MGRVVPVGAPSWGEYAKALPVAAQQGGGIPHPKMECCDLLMKKLSGPKPVS